MPAITRNYIICDRCNKTWEDTHDAPIAMWMQFQSFNHPSNDPASFGFDFENGNTRYYLCPECEEEFANWFLQRSKEKLWGKSADAYKRSVGCPSPEDIPWRTNRCRFEHGKFVDGCKIREEKGCQNCNWYLTDKEAEERGL